MIFFVIAIPPCSAAPRSVDEDSLRAAVIIGILRFTDWPENAAINNEIMICFLDGNSTYKAMGSVSGRELIKRKTVYSRVVKASRQFSDKCNVLVIRNTLDNDTFASLAKLAHHHNILTVCNECAYKNGMLVNLVRKGDHITFEIDLLKARQTGFFFSSSLLELAARVKQ